MKRLTLFIFLLMVLSISTFAQSDVGSIHFDVFMENPNSHYYQVTMECSDLKDDYIDFKLPAWTPGYYWLVNFSKNLINFKAEDKDGKLLSWSKTAKNIWHVMRGDAKTIKVSYSMYSFTQSVADPFLDDSHGYIAPAGLFMHINKQLKHSSIVTIHPSSKWKTISTGLEPVPNKSNTFFAENFDVLYDSPLLLGNQEVLTFEVKGIPHYVALSEPEKFDKPKFVTDLKRIVENASAVVGDIPYKHYTFIIMGEGRGGLEHLNSTAVFSSGSVYNNGDDAGYKRWLNFLTHEYFHLYNIKAIRPIGLGPFDYDKENYTNMLWVSEGFTVYYEYLILNRAGILSKKEVFDFMSDNIAAYENGTGKLFQSATQSSFDTWLNFFNHNENTSNTTISYYDKGAVLGMLLDLKIRNASSGKKSLDDVMRALYYKFYKELKRGFTDKEFQEICESVAGEPLTEIFDYASTVIAIDYQKYLNYAGLLVDDVPKNISECYSGMTIQEHGGVVNIISIDLNSPAAVAGLSSEDEIITFDDEPASAKRLLEILKGKSSGKILRVKFSRAGRVSTTDVILRTKEIKTFNFILIPKPAATQSVIMTAWLRD